MKNQAAVNSLISNLGVVENDYPAIFVFRKRNKEFVKKYKLENQINYKNISEFLNNVQNGQ